MPLPFEMTQYRAWAVSTLEPLPNGKLAKVPRHPSTGMPIDPTDPACWATYEECAAAVNAGRFRCMGFMLSSADPFIVIDLDAPVTDEDRQAAESICAAFAGTYQEISASGTGVHIICRGEIPLEGCRRGRVEIYANLRYMICTGNTFVQAEITNQQEMLNVLYAEMAVTRAKGMGEFDPDADDSDCERSDIEVLEIGASADNANKFNMLCAGQWQELGYPSQSEADLALFNMLTFYSNDNSQCVRIFRMTALGQREKAQRNDYMSYCVGTARAAVEYSVIGRLDNPLQACAGATSQSEPAQTPATTIIDTPEVQVVSTVAEEPELEEWGYAKQYEPLPWPPGWTGHLAHYMYTTALRPVPEVGIMAALGLAAGLIGRSFNTPTGAGLNLYQILVAPTGVGKEGMKSGIDRVLGHMRETLPTIYDRVGPSVIASGQALIKVLDEKPCCISVFGEFGQTIARLGDSRCSASDRMLLQMLLDLYTKSGKGSRLDGMVYSDKTKNVPVLDSPCFSFIGETTPQIYEELDLSMVESGLLPRINLYEYVGDRPRFNYDHDKPIDPVLLRQLCGMALTGFAIEQRKSTVLVAQSPAADEMLRGLNDEADKHINKNRSEAVRQLWNRFHLKVLKVSSLLAVVDNFSAPTVSKEHVAWAEMYCRRDIETWMKKFEQGEIGSRDLRSEGLLQACVAAYAKMAPATRIAHYEVPMSAAGRGDIIPQRYLKKRLKRHSFFQKHPKGTNLAVDLAIKEAVACETLIELPIADKVSLGIAQTAKVYLWKK